MGQSRHLSRIVVMQTLYEWDFRDHTVTLSEILSRNINEFQDQVDEIFANKLIDGITKHVDKINELIIKAAPDWPIDQIAKIDKLVLEISIFELLFDSEEEVPPKVSINEAVEIGKQFGSENSSKFINGVLGTIYKDHQEKLEPRDKRDKQESN